LSEPRSAAVALEIYVWFEADPADAARVLAAFGRLGQAMASGGSDAAVERPRLLCRPELVQRDGSPRATWMEVWPGVPPRTLAGWLDRLDAAAASSGAGALARGGRHVEVFAPQAGPRPG
jgi:hypothetical protein